MKKIIIFLMGVMFMTSCFNDPGLDIILDKSYVEIDEATTVSGLAITKIYTRNVNGAGIRDSLRVNLVGPHSSEAVNVAFAIDASSTAQDGVHYQMITTGNTVSIPANSSFGYIKFLVLDDNIAPTTTTRDLKINLTGAGERVIISTNYSSFTRRIRTQ